ncbi:MAG TPA: XRE family transcriptional regulator [Rhodospirillaceae bacterium]|nr:XRE family transcriptional regulator [Rhodospirillaceae bacterium]
MSTPHRPNISARRAIKKIGADLRTARLRRRLGTQIVAERAFISRGTLVRVEKGDPAVGIGIYASVMHALGLLDRLPDVAAPDSVGELLEAERLPQRIRARKSDV